MKKMLVLGSRIIEHKTLINEGDRALAIGFHALLDHIWNGDIRLTPWKPFVDINYKEVELLHKQGFSIEEIWNRLLHNISQVNKHTIAGELYYKIFKFLFRNRIVRFLDRPIEKKYSIGLSYFLERKLFKSRFIRHFFRQVEQTDIVVLNGAGLIADHIKDHSLRVLLEIYASIKRGKKVGIVNYTYYSRDPFFQELISFVLQKVDFHFVREQNSMDDLCRIGIDPLKIEVAPDSAFYFLNEFRKKSHKDKTLKRNTITLTIRGDRPINFIKWNEILTNISRPNRDIEFLHSCYAHDKKIEREFFKKNILKQLNKRIEFNEYINRIRNSHFLISDRYHAIIFAIIAGIPFIPISSTTHKIHGLCGLIDYPIQPLDNPASITAMDESIEYLENNYQEIEQLISNSHDSIEESLLRKYKLLSDICNEEN